MYQPSTTLLRSYADILINCALNSGEGIKPGEVIFLNVPETAKPLLAELQRAVTLAGGHYITRFRPTGLAKPFYERASDEQISFQPLAYWKGIADQANHWVAIISDEDKYALKDIDPAKLMLSTTAGKPFNDMLDEKEYGGNFTWTLAMYPTVAMANDVGMSLEEYRDKVIKACHLDAEDPVATWKKILVDVEKNKAYLDSLAIEKLHITGEDIDLRVQLGHQRQWLGGSGRNIPSYEIFISPDRRGTQGWVRFNQPLYRHGTVIKGIQLRFEDGLVVKHDATDNKHVLTEMLAIENANKIGEFSLTDKRVSRIEHVMGETLFDENIGGPFGNTHIAIGNAYKDSFTGDIASATKEQWAEMGYNESAEHTDIVSTTDRVVTAHLPDGSEKVIYRDGMFVVE